MIVINLLYHGWNISNKSFIVKLLSIKEKIKIFLFDIVSCERIAMVWFKRLFPRPIRAVDSKYSLVHSIMQIIWLIARLIENDIRRWVGLFRLIRIPS